MGSLNITCRRCDGSGLWINPSRPDDRRKCFTCNGTGNEVNGRIAAPSRSRRPTLPVPDFLEVAFDAGEQALTPALPYDPSTVELTQRLTRVIRNKIADATTRTERDIKGWTRVELDVLRARIEDEVFERLAKRAPVTVELTRNGEALPPIEGHQHPNFSKLLRLATSRGVDGRVPNIWVTGPAGSGKTTGARMVAKALDLPFFYNGALETKFELIGYNDAGGRYHTTAFREAMERPSVYLFDDIDSCDSNAPLLALNGALANGLIAFPDAHVERHPDSIVIATANTWGLGASADYVGRTRLDGAFLDRFGAKLHWGYDEGFERAISGNPTWATQVQKARSAAATAGLKVLITPRASIAGAAYLASGVASDFAEAADLTYLAGLSADQRRLLQ